MTIKEFQKIKKQIDKMLETAENEAISEGINLFSKEYRLAVRKLKEKLLEEMGIGISEFEEMEEQVETEKSEKEKTLEESEVIQLISNKNEIRNKIENIKEDLSKKDIDLEEKITFSVNEINKLVERRIDEIVETASKQIQISQKERDDLKKSVLSDIRNYRNEIENKSQIIESEQKELGKNTNKLGEKLAELSKWQTDIRNSIDKINQREELTEEEKEGLREIIKIDWFNEIQNKIKDITPRLWQGMAMGLQSQIDAVGISIEVPTGTVDGSNTTFTVTNTPRFIMVDGLIRREDKGYTYLNGVITVDSLTPPAYDIISFY